MKAGDNPGAVIRGAAKDVQRIELMLRIEVVAWLVEQVDIRFLRQHLRYRQAPPFTPGQGQYIPARQPAETHCIEGVRGDIAVPL